MAALSSARQVWRGIHNFGGISVKPFTNPVVRVHHVSGSAVTRYCDEVHRIGGRRCLAGDRQKWCPEDNLTTTVRLPLESFLVCTRKVKASFHDDNSFSQERNIPVQLDRKAKTDCRSVLGGGYKLIGLVAIASIIPMNQVQTWWHQR